MGDHGDEYDNNSLHRDGDDYGFGADERVEDMELVEDESSDLAMPSECIDHKPAERRVEGDSVPPAIPVPAALSDEDEQFLAELEKAQGRSRGVWALVLTVLISGALFVVAGTAWWSWELTLTLVPVLLLHELGHFVTMKGFKYRNVNMFFIPLLGAAVTGQQFNVPAWKKAMVALMGPLPSIFLATAIGIVAIGAQLDWLVYVCVIALFLNGLNLVPLLPFDGGHVLHAVLFCRHYYLDVALRVITIVIVLGLALLSGGSGFLIGLAVFLFLTIPITIRNGKIVRQLRSEGNLETLTEEDAVAPAAALRIADALRKRSKIKMNAKTLAQATLQVVEQINTRPPGVLASIGLLFMHGTGLVVVLVAGIGLGFVVNDELMEQFLIGLQPRPLYEYNCNAHETRGDQYVPTHSTKSIFATFATSDEANDAYLAAKPEITPQDHLQRFGQSVSIALDRSATPKDLQTWIDLWDSQAHELRVQSGYNDLYFSLDAEFPESDLAGRVQKELQAYFENPYSYSLNPPWQPGAAVIDPAESEQYRARMRLVEVAKVANEAIDKDGRTDAALRIGDYEELARVSGEIRREAVATYLASHPDIDTVTVDLYLKTGTGEYDKESRRQLIERMGGTFVDFEEEDEDEKGDVADDAGTELAKVDDDSGVGDDGDDAGLEGDGGDGDFEFLKLTASHERYGGSGSVVGSLKTVSLRAVLLNVTAEGARAIADWLCGLGATEITYAFYKYDQ